MSLPPTERLFQIGATESTRAGKMFFVEWEENHGCSKGSPHEARQDHKPC